MPAQAEGALPQRPFRQPASHADRLSLADGPDGVVAFRSADLAELSASLGSLQAVYNLLDGRLPA
jgi:hypothetical protein